MNPAMMKAKRELVALMGAFYFHEGNSAPQKVVLYAAIAVWTLAATGIMFGVVDIQNPTQEALWSFLSAVVVYLFGRVHGKEVRILEDSTPKP